MNDVESADAMMKRHQHALKHGGVNYADLLEEHKV
jgi:hypothetical protein